MHAFFQHVGEQNSARDFPRTLVTETGNLLRFQFSQVERFLQLPRSELEPLKRTTEERTPGGFQIWGVPEGAKSVLRDVRTGDAFLLLRTWGDEGRFGFAGRVVGVPKCHAGEASKHFWGEGRFPLLLFLDGAPSTLPWRDFRDALGYKANWDPRGQTYPIRDERLEASPYINAEGLLKAAITGFHDLQEVGADPSAAAAIIHAELPSSSPEGRKAMRTHLVRERNPSLIQQFKSKLKGIIPLTQVCIE